MRAVAALLLLCVPAAADEPGNGAVCIDITGFTHRITEAAKAQGATVLFLDGVQTIRFLDYVNHQVGKPTLYRAEKLIIELRDRPMPGAAVATISHGCVSPDMITLSPIAFIGAYRAARDDVPAGQL